MFGLVTSAVMTLRTAAVFIVSITILVMIGTVLRTKNTKILEVALKVLGDENPDEKLPEVYEKRGKYVSDMCAKHRAEISSRYKKLWPQENYSSVKGKADVFYNSDIGFLWCRVPKAASESWTGVFIDKWSGFFQPPYN